MKHYYLSIFLATLMSMISTTVTAHDIEVANSDGKTIYYNYNSDGSSVSVTCQGTYVDSYYNEYSGEIVIPKLIAYNDKTYSVTSIDGHAFHNCIDLTSISIPNGVTSIGPGAFYGCSGLTLVSIPNDVTTIGSNAFYGTAWYNNQPDGLVYAGNVAYKYKGTMPANTAITLKEGTIAITQSAFYNCSGLTSVIIPNSVTSIGYGAFENCSGLTSVTIPNSVTSIGSDTFRDCSSLSSVTIGNSITNIGSYAFHGTAWYNNQPNGLVYAGNVAYSYKGTMPDNASITINEGTIAITQSAFYNCSGLTSVTIPNSVTYIGGFAFCECI